MRTIGSIATGENSAGGERNVDHGGGSGAADGGEEAMRKKQTAISPWVDGDDLIRLKISMERRKEEASANISHHSDEAADHWL
jgi:hypothetical protein